VFHETPQQPKEYTVKNAFAGTPKKITTKKHNTTQLKFKTPAVFTAEGDKLCIPIPFPKVTPQQA
jgi:hypothetical protein